MAIITVTTGADSGAGSLRDAIAQANVTAGADEIVFAAGVSSVSISSGIAITNPLTISGDRDGDGVADVTLSGFSQFNSFDAMLFNESTTLIRDVRIEDFTSDNSQRPVGFRNMGVDSSGPILNTASLTLERVQFDDIYVHAGPGAEGLMPLKAPDGSDGTPPTPGSQGRSGTAGLEGGYAYVIGAIRGSLTLSEVGFGQNVRVFGGAGGTGGAGGEGGNGGDGEIDILAVLASGGAGGGNGGWGGAGGTGGVAGYVGLFAGSTLSVTGSIATGGLVGSFGGAGGTGGAGGAGGDGYSDIFQSFPDGPAGNTGFSGPNGFSGSTGFAFSAGGVSTPGGTQNTNFNPQLFDAVAYLYPTGIAVAEGEAFTVNFSRVGRSDVALIINYEIFAGSPEGFTVDDIGNSVLTGTEVIATNQFTVARPIFVTDDMLTEGEEGFFVAITGASASGISVGASGPAAAVTIAASDPLVQSTFDLIADDLFANEGEQISFGVTRGAGAGAYDVQLEIVPGPGITAGDFNLPSLIINAPFSGGQDGTFFNIDVIEDMLPEGQETFDIRINSVTPVDGAMPALIGNGAISGTVFNTGPSTVVDLAPVSLTVDEGSPILFEITRSGDPFSSFTVNYALAPGVGSTFSGADLSPATAITGQAQFGIRAGATTTDTVSISIDTLDDMLTEDTEPFSVQITSIVEDGIILFDANGDDNVVAGLAVIFGEIQASDSLPPIMVPPAAPIVVPPAAPIVAPPAESIETITEGPDRIDGTSEGDTIDALGGNDTVKSLAGDDDITLGSGNDVVLSGTGNDTVFGGGGNDTIKSGDGDDSIEGGDGDDVILSGNDDDTIFGGDGNDVIKPGRGDDVIDGGDDDDIVVGFRGDEIIIGGAGDDTLLGNLGDDTITGGAGNDRMQGGPGRDVFVFDTANWGDDRIVLDFLPQSDTLDFTGSGLTRADLSISASPGGNVLIEAGDSSIIINSARFGPLDVADFGGDVLLFG